MRASLTSELTPKSCEECVRKEKVIGQLYEKMEGLEEAVDAFCKDQQRQLVREKSMGMGQSNQQQLQVNLDQVIKNISELNHLVTENEKEVQYDLAGRVNNKIFGGMLLSTVTAPIACLPFYLLPSGHGARFNKAAVVSLTFFLDGFLVDKGRFRPYTETASQVFLKDLSDGFFPGEMQVRLHLHI